MKTLAEKIAVMQAALEGKKIESLEFVYSKKWGPCKDPNWNWVHCDYRVAPEPEPRIDPGEGWRLLGGDEVICFDDEYMVGGKWYACVSSVGATCVDRKLKFVRRRITPKQYRPFANAEEFRPHRERWWKYKKAKDVFPPRGYSDSKYDSHTWKWRFEHCEFDDGSPFGVEVTE